MPATDVLGRPIGHVVPPEDRQEIVTDWTGYDDYFNAPPSYSAFYRQYYRYTRHLVSKFGVPANDFDDVCHDIIIRFIERDSIGVFSNEWATRSESGKSKFSSYYSRFVVTYARGKTRNVYRHYESRPLILDVPQYEDGTETWLDFLAPPVSSVDDSVLDELEFTRLVSRIEAEIPKADKVLYKALFEVLDLAKKGLDLAPYSLARHTGIPYNAAQRLVEEFRTVVTRVLKKEVAA